MCNDQLQLYSLCCGHFPCAGDACGWAALAEDAWLLKERVAEAHRYAGCIPGGT